MRPLRLVMRAFGPYAREQVIDFRILSDRSFFLIHGPTGSGKTTILDAICFALYGDTSGGERIARHMRSDYAEPHILTEVIFDFSLGNRRFRISRRPEQDRPKRRGQGMTKEPAFAGLWDRSHTVTDEDEGICMASKWQEVDREIAKLMGFKSDQFRQVVILPQGQFRRLLLASSKEREAIFETLFRTEIYRRVEEILKRHARDLEDELDLLQEKKQIILGQAGVSSILDMEKRYEELLRKKKVITRDLNYLKEKEKLLSKKIIKGREIERLIEEAKKAKIAYRKLKEREKDIIEDISKLEKAKKARVVAEVEREYQHWQREYNDILTKIKEAEKELKRVKEEKKLAEDRFNLEQARQKERDELQNDLEHLQMVVREFQLLKKAKNDLDQEIRKKRELSRLIESKKREQAICEKEAIEIKESCNYAKEALLEIKLVELDLKRLKALYGRGKKRDELISKQSKLISEYESKSHQLKILDDELTKKRKTLEEIETLWYEAQAAILARSLEPGKPCPVCGSKEHPDPARYEHVFPEESMIKDLKASIKALEESKSDLQNEVSMIDKRIFQVKIELDAILEEMGDKKEVGVDVLQVELEKISKRFSEMNERVMQIDKMEKKLKELEVKRKSIEEDIEKLKEDYILSIQNQGKKEGIVKEKERMIPQDLREENLLNNRILQLRKKHKELNEAFERAQMLYYEVEKRLSAVKERLKTYLLDKERIYYKSKEAKRTFDVCLKEEGFENEDEFNKYRLSEEDIDLIEKGIREFYIKIGAARDRYTRAEDKIKDLKPIDTKKLQKEERALKETISIKENEYGKIEERMSQIKAWRTKLTDVKKEMKKKDHLYRIVGKLADVAAGKNSYNITFQRFVLASLLDDVLSAASSRLNLMSNGRFNLERQRYLPDKRKSGGLDLVVYDTYTGTHRPVNTLSGGESFLASLSLALGLADVVQAYAGGIKLETVFVDEGFGSLDPESLDLAMRTLIDLQNDGRLVGIISHVPELKERIDVRLEVIPGREGSKAQFVL